MMKWRWVSLVHKKDYTDKNKNSIVKIMKNLLTSALHHCCLTPLFPDASKQKSMSISLRVRSKLSGDGFPCFSFLFFFPLFVYPFSKPSNTLRNKSMSMCILKLNQLIKALIPRFSWNCLICSSFFPTWNTNPKLDKSRALSSFIQTLLSPPINLVYSSRCRATNSPSSGFVTGTRRWPCSSLNLQYTYKTDDKYSWKFSF